MKSINMILAITFILSLSACNAQIKNEKTEQVKIYGNCGMCEKTIENAGSVKKIAKVDWNKDAKMATISYDSLKTTSGEILKRIALSGYDNQLFMAPDDTYAKLPSCCQYERPKKAMATANTPSESMNIASNMNHSKHEEKNSQKESIQVENPLLKVYNIYFDLKNALVNSDPNKASAKSKALFQEINAVNMTKLPMDVHMVWMKELESLRENAKQISSTNDLPKQRDYFMKLSNSLYGMFKLDKQESPTYYQYCPMANDGKGANWLSKETEIKNPYYGSQMLNCGKTVETIK